MAKGFVTDDLHSVYLGVVKQLLTYWFGVKCNQCSFSIRTKVFMTKCVSSVCVPTYTSVKIIQLNEWRCRDGPCKK